MLHKIITGGQTGADQAGWRVAQAFGVPTGGAMPHGFLTEDGPCPEFAALYGASEMASQSYADRTRQNVRDSDATLWFGETTTSGARATIEACQQLAKPCLPIYPSAAFRPTHIADWLTKFKVRTLHVAGNRESDEPRIGEWVERFLEQLLEQLGHRRA